ncbi:hypothetical protein [Xenorhabdus bovienii]|uniref:Phage abortive infection protein n=1 Tax=Xenorhabdus bovienii str. Intermedium TaxID=1379677 RepID=A0A077QG35_XENBV|nr:hypothetical protein [Xenorhabdus bovienii]CDH32369.1 exported hypothetical protein [Xenorhabdus bovienii str. Intermedium]
MKNRKNIILSTIVIIAIGLFALYLLFEFIIVFGKRDIPIAIEKWGYFGSFISGVFSLFSIAILSYTLLITQKHNKETLDMMNKNISLMELEKKHKKIELKNIKQEQSISKIEFALIRLNKSIEEIKFSKKESTDKLSINFAYKDIIKETKTTILDKIDIWFSEGKKINKIKELIFIEIGDYIQKNYKKSYIIPIRLMEEVFKEVKVSPKDLQNTILEVMKIELRQLDRIILTSLLWHRNSKNESFYLKGYSIFAPVPSAFAKKLDALFKETAPKMSPENSNNQ